MSKSTLSITYQVAENGNGANILKADLDGIRELFRQLHIEGEKFKSVFLGTAAITSTFNGLTTALSNAHSAIQSFTAGFVSFDDAMRKTNTMAGKNAEGFEMLKNQVTDLSKEIPVAREALAEGLYQTISNGVPEDNWIEYLRASSRSAVGGVADLGKVVNVTSTMIKNYGLEWSAAEEIQDKIQMTAKNGVTSFEQLADALPRVAANAATLGVSVDELMATFATLTGVSGNTAEVSTQLAAIFTALIKPSSEATQIATQMGIQFNAAAVQAAGGFQNFLTNLQQSVSEFSATSGMLEQEVYGKLFGSAESLRALVPLTGELADKYTENVGAMADATGAMNTAFEDMAGGVTAKNTVIQNAINASMDSVAEFLSSFQPTLNVITQLGGLAFSFFAIFGALIKLINATHILKGATIALRWTFTGLRTDLVGLTVGWNLCSGGMVAAKVATIALKVALRGLLAATGIGLAVMAVVEVFNLFTSSSESATDATDNLTEAQKRAQEVAERNEELQNQVVQSVQSAQAEYYKYTSKVEAFNGTKEEENALIDELNSKYGDLFDRFDTLQQWYRVLTGCSKIYTEQLLAEARARLFADEIAKLDLADYNIRHNADGSQRLYSTKRETERVAVTHETQGMGVTGYKDVEIVGTSDLDKANKKLADNAATRKAYKEIINQSLKAQEEARKQIDAEVAKIKGITPGGKSEKNGTKKLADKSLEDLKAQKSLLETQLQKSRPSDDVSAKVQEYKDVNKAIENREKALGLNKGSKGKNAKKKAPKKVVEGDNLSREQLTTNIELYTKKLTSEDTEEQKVMRQKIKNWREAIDKIDIATRAAQRPQTLDTLKNIDAEIEYQRFLRERSTDDAIAGIDKEIARLEKLKRAMALKNYVASPVDQLETYADLNEEIAAANDLMQMATAEERVQIQKRINELQKLKEKWDEVLENLEKPAPIGQLNNIKGLQKAVQYYNALQQKANGDEFTENQRIINALQKKIDAIQRGASLLDNQTEIDKVNRLQGKEYKVKVRSYGFEELTDKIKELNRQLNDLDNPPTDGQRKMIKDQIKVYEKWRAEGVKSFDTYRSGWTSLSGGVDAINSITAAIEGDGNAWEKTTAIVSAGLQIYDSIAEVVALVDMLTVALGLKHDKTMENVEADTLAGATAVTAAGMEATGSGIAVGAKEAETEASHEKTTANVAEAASGVMAAHASIPWVGIAIGAGMLAVMLGLMAGLPKFADGGIAYGPTLGLFGEYAGASSNPEVVAPLNKLKTLIEPREAAVVGGHVEFEIDGRKLRGVLNSVNKLSSRS